MTNEVKNVPEIRFPEFDDEWKEKKFYECVEIEGKLVNPNFHEYQNLPHIGPGNIQKNTGRILNYNLVKDENLISGKFEFDEEDIIYGKINPQLQKICIPGFRGLASADTYPIKTISGVSNTYFIYYSLFTSRFFKYSVSVSMRTGMPKINKEELGSYNFYLPKIMEQQKIGGFFSKLDRQIELEEQKLSLLEEQKKGYMQKIFSQELRFKDENGNDYPNWIFKELNNIFTKYQNTIYLHDNEEYKRISISNKGKITHRDITFGKRIGRKRQYLIDLKKHPNTLTFIRQGVFLGGIGFIPSSLDGYIVTENMPLLSMSEEYSKKFMTYLFSSESYYKSVIFKNLPTGSAQKALHEKDWLKSFVNIPVYSEQEKIGNFFEKQDNLIKKQSDKVELLKERKKGFLQKMFV